MITSQTARRLGALLYLAGFLLLADQVADLAATFAARPFTPSQATWRFGAFGLALTRISVLLVADVMLFAAALLLSHRGVVRSLGVLHLVFSLVLLAAVAIFVLDWIQVRTQVPAGGRGSVDLAGVRAAGMAVLFFALTLWAGIASLRATRSARSGRRAGSAPLLSGPGTDDPAR